MTRNTSEKSCSQFMRKPNAGEVTIDIHDCSLYNRKNKRGSMPYWNLPLDRGICKYAQPRERMVWSDCPGDARLFRLFAALETSRVKDKGAYCGA